MDQETTYGVEVRSPVGVLRMDLTADAAMAVVAQLFPLVAQVAEAPAPAPAPTKRTPKRPYTAIATCVWCGEQFLAGRKDAKVCGKASCQEQQKATYRHRKTASGGQQQLEAEPQPEAEHAGDNGHSHEPLSTTVVAGVGVTKGTA